MNSSQSDERCTEVLISLRKIIRAIDLRSRRLMQEAGFTGPQLLVMQALARAEEITAGDLAKQVNLSQGTITSILDRLEKRELVKRIRSDTDRRRVFVSLTGEGRERLSVAPTLLQERFIQRFAELKEWEQHQMLASLQRLAEMMDAQDIDAAPVLDTRHELASSSTAE